MHLGNSFSDFDNYEKESSKMKDWRFITWETDWAEARMKYTSERHITYSTTDLPLYHCPDLVISADESGTRNQIYDEVCKITDSNWIDLKIQNKRKP